MDLLDPLLEELDLVRMSGLEVEESVMFLCDGLELVACIDVFFFESFYTFFAVAFEKYFGASASTTELILLLRCSCLFEAHSAKTSFV